MRRDTISSSPSESAAADEQDVPGVDLQKFLVGVLASALRRDVGHAPFDYLEQLLLYALPGNVPGDGAVDALLAGNLVQLVNVDDAALGLGDVPVRGLD